MAEMPDVVAGETIESEWGNDIRDRTIQRYANLAERTSLNASPTVGDLSYLEDTGQVDVYHAGSWRPLTASGMVRAAVRDAGPNVIASVEGPEQTLNITIPSTWNSYDLYVWASFDLVLTGTLSAVRTITNRLRYSEATGSIIGANLVHMQPGGPRSSNALNGMLLATTITGTRTIVYTAELSAESAQVSWANLALMANAYRVT